MNKMVGYTCNQALQAVPLLLHWGVPHGSSGAAALVFPFRSRGSFWTAHPSLSCFVKQCWEAQPRFFWDQPKPDGADQEHAHGIPPTKGGTDQTRASLKQNLHKPVYHKHQVLCSRTDLLCSSPLVCCAAAAADVAHSPTPTWCSLHV